MSERGIATVPEVEKGSLRNALEDLHAHVGIINSAAAAHRNAIGVILKGPNPADALSRYLSSGAFADDLPEGRHTIRKFACVSTFLDMLYNDPTEYDGRTRFGWYAYELSQIRGDFHLERAAQQLIDPASKMPPGYYLKNDAFAAEMKRSLKEDSAVIGVLLQAIENDVRGSVDARGIVSDVMKGLRDTLYGGICTMDIIMADMTSDFSQPGTIALLREVYAEDLKTRHETEVIADIVMSSLQRVHAAADLQHSISSKIVPLNAMKWAVFKRTDDRTGEARLIVSSLPIEMLLARAKKPGGIEAAAAELRIHDKHDHVMSERRTAGCPVMVIPLFLKTAEVLARRRAKMVFDR